MQHPEWALKHKTKGTELRCIRGKYYLYRITSKWDKELKRAKKITLGHIGTITEEHGLVPTGLKKPGPVPKKGTAFKDPLIEQEKDKSQKMIPFLDICSTIDDPRSTRNQLHTLPELLFVALSALICDADGWQDMETYGIVRQTQLQEYLEYKHGTPSDDTLRRFCRALDPSQFKALFRALIMPLVTTVKAKLISFDGKVSRHSYDGDGRPVHMVSAFSSEERIVLGQEKVDDKSNEITAIPKILEWLDVKDHTVTIDAMGCQYAIADQIIQKQGNYIFSLKGNQGNLSDDVVVYFEEYLRTRPSPLKEDENHCVHYDKGHGRIETRECFVVRDVDWLKKRYPKWQSIQSIVQIKSTREMKNKKTVEERYYISSLSVGASTMLHNVRSHWAIENSLHWVLDMTFGDDQSRIRKDNAPQIIAILRHIAANALQSYKATLPKSDKISIRGLRKLCAWDYSVCEKVLSRVFS
jgi:predicted transposase YbfD/YdcC